jgi:hypothetical protein
MRYIFWAEKIILKKSNWNINLFNSLEIIQLIIKQIFVKHNIYFSNNLMNKYIEMINTFIIFSLSEYTIYNKYNHVIISLVCSIIGILYLNDDNNIIKENDLINYQKIIKEEILKLNIIKNKIIIEQCEKDILFQLENNLEEENDDEEIYNLALTRSSSCNSLIESFFNYDKDNFKSYENKNVNLHNFDNSLFNSNDENKSFFLEKKRHSSYFVVYNDIKK